MPRLIAALALALLAASAHSREPPTRPWLAAEHLTAAIAREPADTLPPLPQTAVARATLADHAAMRYWQLRGVAGVLQGAAAAGGVMRTSGRNALRRRDKDIDGFCGRVAFFAFENADGNAFARQRTTDEMGLAVVAGDAARFIIEAGDVEGEGAGHNRDGKR